MNVTCPACSSRYAIPDEKIAGRRARIKCKRCGQLVSVDGRHLTPPQAPPPPSAPPRAAPAAAHPSAAPATPSRWTLAQPSGAKAQIDTATLVALYREQRVEPGALRVIVPPAATDLFCRLPLEQSLARSRAG